MRIYFHFVAILIKKRCNFGDEEVPTFSNPILLTFGPEKLLVEGEQALLYSMVRNVVDNALLYASGATMLHIQASSQDGQVSISFADNGVGVQEPHLSHLFERFYRVDKGRSRSLGGTGLGLGLIFFEKTRFFLRMQKKCSTFAAAKVIGLWPHEL